MSDFSRLAKETGAACVCTSQFSRRRDEFFYRKPRLSDLKEAGEIENTCDGVVCVWWRFKDYCDKPEEQRRYQETDYTLCVLKNRQGAADIDTRMVIDLESLRVYEEEVEGMG
jgi:replicative DNA helicase